MPDSTAEYLSYAYGILSMFGIVRAIQATIIIIMVMGFLSAIRNSLSSD